MKLLWQGYDPDILPKKLQQIFRKQNLEILSQTLGKARRGAQWKLIFFWRGIIASWEEKLKIATFTEAPFMVNLDFWSNKFFFLEYLRNNSWVKYLKLSQTFSLTRFLLRSKGGLCISSPKNEAFRWKIYLKYLGAHKMRGKVEEALIPTFNEP